MRAEVDDGQRVARLDGAEDVARDQRVDLLGALALVGREQDAGSPPCACTASPAGGGRRSRRRPRRGRRRCAGSGVSSSARKSPFWRSKSTRQTGRPGAVARRRRAPSWSATVVVPTPPLEPATAISWPPSARAGRLLAGDAVAHRRATTARRRARWPRSARARAGARRRRAGRPASRRAAASGESSAASRTARPRGSSARCRARPRAPARRRARRGAATTSTSSRRSARGSSSASATRSTTSSPRPRGPSAAARWASLVVGDRDQQPRCCGHPAASRAGAVGRSLFVERASDGRRAAAARAGPRAANDSRVGDAQLLLRRERERDRHDLRRVGAAASWTPRPPFSCGLADVDDPRAPARRRSDLGLMPRSGRRSAKVATMSTIEPGLDLARDAGLGVDEDRDLALARAELGRGDRACPPAGASRRAGRSRRRGRRAGRGRAARLRAPSASAS